MAGAVLALDFGGISFDFGDVGTSIASGPTRRAVEACATSVSGATELDFGEGESSAESGFCVSPAEAAPYPKKVLSLPMAPCSLDGLRGGCSFGAGSAVSKPISCGLLSDRGADASSMVDEPADSECLEALF